MKLFDFTLPSGGQQPLLYFRTEGQYSLSEGALAFCGAVSFDTYFNCFSYSKYLKHTKVENIKVRIQIKGEATAQLRLCAYSKEKEENIIDKELASIKINAYKKTTHYIECDLAFLNGFNHSCGFIYLKLLSDSECVFYGGGYESEIADVNTVKVGMVICTYKREESVKANTAKLKELLNEIEAFVVDNGGTLNESELNGATLIKNRNLGGSGGFTRGIVEVVKRGGFTHFLLSDDDIFFNLETLKKTINILRVAKNPEKLVVGASMIRSDNMTLQHELGAKWKGSKVYANNHNFDLTERAFLLANETEKDADYTGWWWACMPVAFAEKFGLPLPLFIKHDDVEYSLRCDKELMLVNGIGVWHEPFENKYNPSLEYYIKRNELIVSSLYDKDFFKCAVKKLFASVGKQLIFQRYFAIRYIYKAYSDFLKGAKFLLDSDPEELNAVLRKDDFCLLSKDELNAKGYATDSFYKEDKNNSLPLSRALTLNGYLIPKVFYDKSPYRVVDMRDPKIGQFHKAAKVVQYNPSTGQGFITEIKKGEMVKHAFKTLCVFIKFIFKAKAAKRSYKKSFSRLTSFENWEKLFNKV
ncbi:MAG: glycosyltransferase family 2 protein [Clostridiales bacterium]|nr:glycosyltransferase family 2 protein [Clostridiales bacterium]